MHTVIYKNGKYFVEGYPFCRDLFELFTPSNMHILTETGKYTGDIKIVAGRSMYVQHEPDGVWLCNVKMKGSYPIKNKNHILINYKGNSCRYSDANTNIFIQHGLLDFGDLKRIRFVLENKHEG